MKPMQEVAEKHDAHGLDKAESGKVKDQLGRPHAIFGMGYS
jgi:hypothetical protein